MKNKMLGLAVGLIVAVAALKAYAVQQNLDSHGIGDSANTASTFVFRDASGNFSAGAISASGAVAVTGDVVSVATSSTSNFPVRLRGAYTTTQLASLSAAPGDIVVNITVPMICVSSATSAALPGAWVALSTAASNAQGVRPSCTL